MEVIFVLLLTFVTPKDVSSIALRNEKLVEHATFRTLSHCEQALISYAKQTDPILDVKPNNAGRLEAFATSKNNSIFKVSCLRIILSATTKLSLG